MADQPDVKTTDQLVTASEVKTPEPNLLETTTAKDGNLPINISLPTAPVASTADTPPPVLVPEQPIVVSEAEVNSSAVGSSGDSISSQVENLSGEIQALEAKIDRLTGNIKPVAEATQPESTIASITPTTPAIPATSSPTPTSPPAPTPIKSEQKTVAVNDIYSKVAERQKEAEKQPTTDADDAQEVGSGVGVGLIGEVLLVFGVLIFMAMTAFPVYKSMLSDGVVDAIRSIGWPTAVVSLAIGFLLSLFNKGKVATKVFGIILLLIAAVIYMGIAGYERFLGPLATILDSVFSFYR